MDIVVSMPRLPQIGETISGMDVHYVPGGKGANQALACSRLTADVAMIGCVGKDVFGEAIRDQMNGNGVSLAAIKQLDGVATGTAHISHTPEDNCIVVVPGANGHCTADVVRQFEETLKTSKIVLAQLEVPLDAVRTAFAIAKENCIPTVLNPAPAQKLPHELLELTDYITPNESEWELLYGQAMNTEARLGVALREWEERYSCKVIVTRGEIGCSYLEQGKLMTAGAPKVKAVDTTGAGDAFNGAFVYGLSIGQSLRDSIAFAVKAASLSVQTFGAQDGMPRLEQLQQ